MNVKPVEDPTHFRNVVVKRVNLILPSKEMCINLEKGIFNSCIQKAKNELNWSPRLNLKSTINLTANWYKHYFKNNNKKIEFYTNEQIQYFLDK